MLGLDNPIHILFLLVIVLLVFGARRLPEMGRSLGEGLRGFRDSVSGESPVHHLAHDERQMTADEIPRPAVGPAAEWSGERSSEDRTPVHPAA